MSVDRIDDEMDGLAKPFVALHLSDIHFGQEKGEAVEINADARGQLIRKVREIAAGRRQANLHPIDRVIVTGDVAYSGKASEYATAFEWLTALTEAAGCPRLAIQVIPGNHDVDRGSSFMVGAMLKNLYEQGADLLAKVLGHEEDRGALYRRLEAYQVFASGYGCALDTAGGHAGITEHQFLPGYALRVLGLNSALLCCGKETLDDPKLLLGAKQRIIPDVDGVEYVVLVHHPMSWLADGATAKQYIYKRARILMCGHEHRPAITVVDVAGNAKVMQLDAGATVPDVVTNEFTYTFNLIEIELVKARDAVDVTISPYKWHEADLKFVEDEAFWIGSKPRRERLVCPKFALATREGSAGYAVEADEVGSTAADDLGEGSQTDDPGGEDPSSVRFVSDGDAEFDQARSVFFHKLGSADRLRVLVALNAIPDGLEGLTTNLMVRQLNRIRNQGLTRKLAIEVARVAACRSGESDGT